MSGPNLPEITQKQKQVWGTGDFNVLALQVMGVSETTVAAVDPSAGQKVLDVACGSGNAALVAARRNCDVSGIDYVASLVERAKQRAVAEGTKIDFREADAQALPFKDGEFDAVVSVFGVMFAPDQEKAAAELLRVTKKGGKIGLAVWMPEGFGGEFFSTVRKYAPPPEGLKPPLRWGTDDGLAALLGPGVASMTLEKRSFLQYYRSIEHLVETMTSYFGPLVTALAKQDAAGKAALLKDLAEVGRKFNRATDGTVRMDCRYLQVLATRQ